MGIAVRFAAKGNGTGTTTISTGTTVAIGSNNNSVTGDTLVVLINDPQSSKSVSDTINGAASGNTWTRSGTQLTVDATKLDVWYCQNANGGTDHRVTVTGGGNMDAAVFFYCISGAASASFDKQAQGADASSPYGDSLSTGTLSQANELAIAVYGTSGDGGTISGGAGWTNGPQETNGLVYWVAATAYRVTSATTALSASFTNSAASNFHGVHILTFKEASDGGVSTAGRNRMMMGFG